MVGLKPENLLAKKISIGVTGFSKAGKTIFITSLAQALDTAAALDGNGTSPLTGFAPFDLGQLKGAIILKDAVALAPRFPFEKILESLCSASPEWPERTENVSRLAIDLYLNKQAPILGKKANPLGTALGFGRIQIELIDYPGEWLIDFPMLNLDYTRWSEEMLSAAETGPRKHLSAEYLAQLSSITSLNTFDEHVVKRLSDTWATYLTAATEQGLILNQPGRLLRPGDLENSTILNLVPLPAVWVDTAFYAGMQKRFSQYKKDVIKPFYKQFFSKIDRQIVLVDLLQALQQGKFAFTEMTEGLGKTLESFSCGQGTFLDRMLGNRISHVLFAATKADHVTSADRANLRGMLKKIILKQATAKKITLSAKAFGFLEMASMSATADKMTVKKPHRRLLYGRAKGDSAFENWDPGDLPVELPIDWKNLQFEFLQFEPMEQPKAYQEGFRAINLGKAMDFLVS